MTDPRLTELIAQIDGTPFGDQEFDLIHQGLELAASLGDIFAEYRLRLRLLFSTKVAGDIDATLAGFAWCLAKHEADPIQFPFAPDHNRLDLMAAFEWIVRILVRNTRFSWTQIDRVLTQMDDCYRRNGLTGRAPMRTRIMALAEMGRINEFESLLDEFNSMDADDSNTCLACDYSNQITPHLVRGYVDKAAKTLHELMQNRESCNLEPESAMAKMVSHVGASGDADLAKVLYATSWHFAQGEAEEKLIVFADNITFCAQIGSLDLAVRRLNEYLPRAVHHRHDHEALLHLWQAGWITCAALVNADESTRQLAPAAGEFLADPHDWSAGALLPRFRDAAQTLARAFDERNCNSWRSTALAEMVALELPHFELSAFVGDSLGDSLGDEPGGGLATEVDLATNRTSDFLGSGESRRLAPNWAERLRFLWDAGATDLEPAVTEVLNNPDNAAIELLAWQARLRFPTEPGQPHQETTEARYLACLRQCGFDARADWWPRLNQADLAAALQAAAPVPLDVLALASQRIAEIENPDIQHWTAFDTTVMAALRDDDPQLRTDILRWAIDFARTHGDTERARDCVTRLERQPAPNPGLQLATHLAWIRLATVTGDYDSALTRVPQVLKLADALGHKESAWLESIRDLGEVANRLDISITMTKKLMEGLKDTELVAEQIRLGEYLVRAKRLDEAAATLRAALAHEDRPDQLMCLYYWLALAEDDSNHLATALDQAATVGDLEYQAILGTEFAHWLIRDRQFAAAEAVLEKTISTANQLPHRLDLRANVWEQLGWLRCFTKDPSGPSCFDHAIAATPPGPERANYLDSKARGCLELGATDLGVAAAKASATEFLAQHQPDEAASVTLVGVDLLGRAGRLRAAMKLINTISMSALSPPAQATVQDWKDDLREALPSFGLPGKF